MNWEVSRPLEVGMRETFKWIKEQVDKLTNVIFEFDETK